jgi:penicillin-binding protein 1A
VGLRQQALQTRESISDRLDQFGRRLPPPLKRRRNQYILGGLLLTGLLLGGGRLAYWQMDRSLPAPRLLSSFLRRGTVTIKSVDGTVLQQTGDATRQSVQIDKLPKNVKNAFIAAEDRRFYDHTGVDFQGIARAVVRNITSGGAAEGGSTITQQVARMAFLNQDRTLTRKLKEAVLAQKLEREIPKDKLMEHYLNLVYLGSEAYGVADAAWVYFSKPVDKLTLGETALIAGLPPAPSSYSPLIDQDAARKRRNLVLDRMLEQNFITPDEATQAKAEEVKLKQATPKHLYSNAPYFTDYVQKELPKLIKAADLEAGGLVVETTLNSRWQKVAEDVVLKHTGKETGEFAFQGALVSLDPSNGEIRAMVGGKDYYGKIDRDDPDAKPDAKYKGDQFNRATEAKRQPGSTFKTFVYTAAIASGFSPYKSYQDAPFHVDGYEPKNYGNTYSGYLDLRQALAKSANTVAVKLLIDVGFDPVIKMAQGMGIKSKLEPVYSMALGSYEVNLMEMTSGYGTLAAKGMHTDPHGIRKVTNAKGEVLYNADYKPKRVVDEQTSAIMTSMLQSVVDTGTGNPASLLDRAAAGKTGTSEKARDLWFIGYIPQLVTGVWLGYEDDRSTGGSSAESAGVWRQFMDEVTKDITKAEFPKMPEGRALDDRKGSIKAVAVKPNRRYDKAVEKENSRRRRDDSYDSGGGGSSRYAEPAPEPRYYAPEPEPYYPPAAPDPEPYYPPEPEPPAAAEPPPAAPEPAPADPIPPADPGGAEPAPPQ